MRWHFKAGSSSFRCHTFQACRSPKQFRVALTLHNVTMEMIILLDNAHSICSSARLAFHSYGFNHVLQMS